MQFGRKLNKNDKGFTLVELIVTVVILALVTAPFLSSFASASKANVKAKHVEEANELSQYIIEQFKASSVNKLISEYKLTPGEGVFGANTKRSTYYEGKLSKEATTGALPAGFSDKYEAVIKMEPSTSVVNGDFAIPVIDNLDRTHCAVFAQNITKYDASFSGATSRAVKVTISRDATPGVAKPYKVELEVGYKNSLTLIGSKSMSWEYATVPSVYILYSPKSTADTIDIQNNLYSDDDLEVDGTTGEGKLVSVYLINQKDALGTFVSVPATNVSVFEKQSDTKVISTTLSKLFSNDTDIYTDTEGGVTSLKSTVIYTNFASGNDRDYTVNGAVGMKKIETIYNLGVTVNYDGAKVASYSASKSLDN